MAADGHDALLVSLAGDPDEAVVEIDAGALEPHGLGDAKPGAVEELDERLVAEVARLRPLRRVDEPLCLARGQRLRKRLRAPRQRDCGGGVVTARAEQLQVAVEAARR